MADAVINLYWAAVDLYRALGGDYDLPGAGSPEVARTTFYETSWDEQRGLLLDLGRAIDAYERSGHYGAD
jgi:hypothetical protein